MAEVVGGHALALAAQGLVLAGVPAKYAASIAASGPLLSFITSTGLIGAGLVGAGSQLHRGGEVGYSRLAGTPGGFAGVSGNSTAIIPGGEPGAAVYVPDFKPVRKFYKRYRKKIVRNRYFKAVRFITRDVPRDYSAVRGSIKSALRGVKWTWRHIRRPWGSKPPKPPGSAVSSKGVGSRHTRYRRRSRKNVLYRRSNVRVRRIDARRA